ncbi:MAG: Kae1-associated serine/threonine protein kinase [Candidatus Aenigmarchaeota archaeon]|nr:Kae1-associated serine/threonine protein kinase [Candidatus Aenigmarchaeota archaeon]
MPIINKMATSRILKNPAVQKVRFNEPSCIDSPSEGMIIARGAEAVINLENNQIIKERIRKGYRLTQLDETLRKKRNRNEASLLREARRAGVDVPQILDESEFSIKMEFIGGVKVKDAMNENNAEELAEKIAASVAKLHNKGIVHGDLTTSNMIIKGNNIFFIDFGLGFFSQKAEDMATDLYLLHEALESTHFSVMEKAWKTILNAYKEGFSGADKVIKTLAEIEKRGRYRER